MYSKTLSWFRLAQNMGIKYILYRLWYEAQKRLGIMEVRFPTNPASQRLIALSEWRSTASIFHFKGEIPSLNHDMKTELRERVSLWKQGEVCFFGVKWLPVSGWHTHPQTHVLYDASLHWSRVKIYAPESGDIKWIWEKSRFAFLYDLIRYDFHFKVDQSEEVISCIVSWINENPVNCGPNWVCSQEISLRILAWTFALQYYQNAAYLTEGRLDSILNSIYQQILHVEENISFSRTFVRNNHAITETFALYFSSLVYPFFPGSETRKTNGKKWFTKEITFQIEEDGSFLQSSMNYHRMVAQLMTLAIRVSEEYQEPWDDVFYSKANSSLDFLLSSQDKKTGQLPNYGNNDGSLIFPLTGCSFQDFRPQLHSLSIAVHHDAGFGTGPWEEEAAWLGLNAVHQTQSISNFPTNSQFKTFENGGYFILRDHDTLTFLRCTSYRHRPFQTDNLHLDIWVDGENIMRDTGTYLYTSSDPANLYFSGSSAHNTVGLGSFDQMRKGPGFIWFDWVRESNGRWSQEDDSFVFEGSFEGFRQAGRKIRHSRRVVKKQHACHWVIEDELWNAPPDFLMNQFWHPSKVFFDQYHLKAYGRDGHEIEIVKEQGWYAESYGSLVPCIQIRFTTAARFIRTIICSKSS